MAARRRARLVRCLATVAVTVGTMPLLHPPIHAATTGVLVGVFPGNLAQTPQTEPSVPIKKAIDAWQGKTDAIMNFYSSWDPQQTALLFESVLPQVWASHSVPLISWAPEVTGGSYAAINDGVWDTYLQQWSAQLKAFLEGPDKTWGTADDARVYIRMAYEMNEDADPWEVGWQAGAKSGTPLAQTCSEVAAREAAFKAMWRHVHDVVMAGLDSDHAAWVFAPGAFDSLDASGCPPVVPQIYPGDAYVDWFGIDGYDRHPTDTPDSVFDGMINTMTSVSSTRPIGVTEWGAMTCAATNAFGIDAGATACSGGDSTKDAWMQSFFSWVATAPVKMALYFDRNSDDDWSIFCPSPSPADPYCKSPASSACAGATTLPDTLAVHYDAWPCYRQGVQSSVFIGADTSNPRLLTTAQFLGQ